MTNKKIIKNIISCAETYQRNAKKENSRFRAWEYCYKAFNDVHNSHKHTEKDIDYLCLHLANYLSNWGMLRNSFLLERDYKVHKPIVEEILKASDCLWGMEVNQYNQAALDELVKKIIEKYESIRENVYKEKGKPKPKKQISDTLITKIIMGTLGCVPAFDKYFVYSINKLIDAPKNFSKNSMKQLIEFYKENYDDLEKVRKTMKIDNSDLEYPPMKILDMGFWQYGKDYKNNYED